MYSFRTYFPITRRTFSGLLTLAVNILWGRILNRPIPRGPAFVTWLLTFDCNAYCTFCGTHMLKKKFPATIELERALKIADEIADSGTWVVGFTGGEVFLSPLLFPLIERLKERGLVVYVVTNGLELAANAQRLVDLGIDLVVVSIDFDNAQEHDEARKLNGLFAAAVAGIAELKRLRHNNLPIIRINSVLMRDTLSRTDSILGFLQGLADDVSIQPITLGSEATPHCRDEERMGKYLFGDMAEDEVRAIIDKQLLSKKAFNNSYTRKFADFWFDPNTLAGETPCWAPFLRLLIQPTGEVMHCAANSRFGPVGDLSKISLMDAWNGIAMRRDRKIIGCKENECICWTRDTSFNSLMSDLKLPNRLPYLGKRNQETRE